MDGRSSCEDAAGMVETQFLDDPPLPCIYTSGGMLVGCGYQFWGKQRELLSPLYAIVPS